MGLRWESHALFWAATLPLAAVLIVAVPSCPASASTVKLPGRMGSGQAQPHLRSQDEVEPAAALVHAVVSELELPANAALVQDARLGGISCPSAANCTASGNYVDASGNTEAMVAIETGRTWAAATEISPPADANADPDAHLYAISCPSAANCTASGDYVDASGNTQAMAATETAGTWGQAVQVTPPADALSDPQSHLSSISCWSPGDCTATGQYDNSSGTFTTVATETAGRWAQATTFGPGQGGDILDVQPISCPSAGNCALVVMPLLRPPGYPGMPTVAAETPGTWSSTSSVTSSVTLPANASPNAGGFRSISCWSPANCTAGGGYEDSSSRDQAMAANETTGTWSRAKEVPGPAGAAPYTGPSISAISCPDAGSCMAVGDFAPVADYGPESDGYQEAMVATETAWTWAQATALTPPDNASPGIVSSDVLPGTVVTGVSCAIAGHCAVSGYYEDTSGNVQAMVANLVSPPVVTTSGAVALAHKTLVARVGLSCENDPCSGTVQITEPVSAKPPAILASAHYRLGAGAYITAHLEPTAKGRTLLEGASVKSPLHEDLVITVTGGLTTTKIVPLT